MKKQTFEKQEPSCKFSIPARPTVRQQMQYFSATAGAAGSDLLVRYWHGARILITDWECPAIEKVDADLDQMTDPKQTEVLIWAGLQVRAFIDKLGDIPKN